MPNAPIQPAAQSHRPPQAPQAPRKLAHLSQTVEQSTTTPNQQQDRWLAENRAALESSNAYVKAQGLPLAQHMRF